MKFRSRIVKAVAVTVISSVALTSLPLKALAQSGSQTETALLRKLARRAGRISTAVAVGATRPAVNAAAFLHGLFEHEDKNPQAVAILKILLEEENLDKLSEISQKTGNPTEFAKLLTEEVIILLQERGEDAILSVLHDVQPSVDLDGVLRDVDPELDFSSLTVEKIRANAKFREFTAAVPMDAEDVLDAILSNDLEYLIDGSELEIESLGALLPTLQEAVGAIVTEALLAPIVLTSISSVAASLYVWPLTVGFVGAGVSVWQCLKKTNQERIDKALAGAQGYTDPDLFANDLDLAAFCSKVTNDSVFKLLKSRSKGYVAGKKAKKWLRRTFPRRSYEVPTDSVRGPASRREEGTPVSVLGVGSKIHMKGNVVAPLTYSYDKKLQIVAAFRMSNQHLVCTQATLDSQPLFVGESFEIDEVVTGESNPDDRSARRINVQEVQIYFHNLNPETQGAVRGLIRCERDYMANRRKRMRPITIEEIIEAYDGRVAFVR